MMTLALGIATISGCAQQNQVTTKAKPVKPTLETVVDKDNMVCFGKHDAIKLGLYILELERSN